MIEPEKTRLDRRGFLHGVLAAGALLGAGVRPAFADEPAPKGVPREPAAGEPLFRISLAQWSLHRALEKGELDTPGFVRAARADYGLDAVEYVNKFLKDRAGSAEKTAELAKICADGGVKSLLIMCDGEGRLGDPDAKARGAAIENHRKWLDMAKALGCRSIRVNAASEGSREEQTKLAADGLRRLADLGAAADLDVLVENHGGISSDGAWLAGVMRAAAHPRLGTLPDFGNFHLGDGKWYDRYLGVEELMPFAKAVSAKSHAFDAEGNETGTDYRRMLRIVVGAGYRGHVGIEFEGGGISEREGVLATKRLLERVHGEIVAERAGGTRSPGTEEGR